VENFNNEIISKVPHLTSFVRDTTKSDFKDLKSRFCRWVGSSMLNEDLTFVSVVKQKS